MVAAIAEAALKVDGIDALLAADLGGKSVADTVTAKVTTIGREHGRAPHGDAGGRDGR